MAERHLARETEQNIETDAGDCGERERRHHEHVVAVRHRREAERRREERAEDDEGQRLHTFFTSARPKIPFGAIASATITSENVTICV